MTGLLPCPFCGGEAKFFDMVGTQLEWGCNECSANMGLQKSDFMTLEERDTWDSKTYSYAPALEHKCRKIATKWWNTRNGEDKG